MCGDRLLVSDPRFARARFESTRLKSGSFLTQFGLKLAILSRLGLSDGGVVDWEHFLEKV